MISLEVPRERKDFDNDIVRPLGPFCFRREYQMRREYVYKIFSILRKELKKEFIKSKTKKKKID